MDTAKIFVAAESIDYAMDAVVSKAIIKKQCGNITLFAFAQGEELAEHSSPHEAFIQVLGGKTEIIINKKSNMLTAGDCIILPANIPHSLKAVEKFKMLLVMIKS